MSNKAELFILGHENKRQALQRLYTKGRIPASFIMAGVAGIGKKLVAFELYRSFYCETTNPPYGGCGSCKSCRLFVDQTLPYYRYIDCSNKDFASVDYIRELLRSLHFKTGENEVRVVILDNAENLSIQAQNVLLKSLEEPRANTFYALITSSPSKLLQTIQSRCQLWFFDTLSTEQIKQLIERKNVSAQLQELDSESLTLLADGSMQNLDTLLEYQAEWQEARELLRQISKGELSKVFASLQEFKTNKELLRMRLTIFRIMARQAMLKSKDLRKSYAWSVFLSNIVWAEQLIFERNLSAELVLQNISLSLLNSSRFQTYTTLTHDARLVNTVTV